jgi:hypothetical protein
VPGYPTYAQGQGAPYAPYPPQYQPYPPYYPYGPYAYPPMQPRRAPGETYALVVSWIVTVVGALSIIPSLLVVALGVLVTLGGSNSLSDIGLEFIFGLVPLLGGIVAMIFGIQGILRRPSHTFTLPSFWFLLALTLLALGAGVVLWNIYPAPGSALATAPLVVMSGLLPALTILALATQRLGKPSTRRHTWMSLAYGATLGALLAIITELVAGAAIILVANSLGNSNGGPFDVPTSPTNLTELVIMLLIYAVVAPVVEETLKPLGAVLIIRRLRTRSEDFLVGLAAGIGFNIIETVGVYIMPMGQSDWITIALVRLGGGLLHGVGAGLATLGWWYLINGKGVPLRFLKGFGLILYAMAQHAINNGANVLFGLLPGPVLSALSQPFYLGRLPIPYGYLPFTAFDALILGVLLWVTAFLRRIDSASAPSSPQQTGGAVLAQGGSR